MSPPHTHHSLDSAQLGLLDGPPGPAPHPQAWAWRGGASAPGPRRAPDLLRLNTALPLSLQEVLRPYGAFWLASAFSIFSVLFTLACVPETKGKTLEQITAHFEGR